MTGTTGRDGTAPAITLKTGIVAAGVRIKAVTTNLLPGTSPAVPFESPVAGLKVAFRNLQPFVPDTSYVVTTGSHNNTPAEPYACGDPLPAKDQRCDNHRDQNLSGSAVLLRNASIFAAFYYQQFGHKLRLNDMSLPGGGVFEIAGNWNAGEHWYHRVGVDVDVSRHVLDANGNVLVGALHLAWLTKWIKINLQGKRIREGPIHYRLSADEIDEVIRQELQ